MAKPIITNKSIIDQAEFNGVTIWRKEGGSIEVSDTNYPSIKAAIMDIAARSGVKLQDEWNTQYAGWYLIQKLKRHKEVSKIQSEIILSGEYDLVTDENGYVELSKTNVAKVEAMIRNDSDYMKSGNVTSGPNGKYGGSTAYWANHFSKIYKNDTVENERKIVEELVKAIDRENSTHLNADNVGIDQITDRIMSHLHTDLWELLKEPEKSRYEIIDILSQETKVAASDTKHKPRQNYSFATKFCHYVCYYLFDSEIEQDNFSIYDFFVANAIPKYAKKYGIDIKEINMKCYPDYIATIDKIIEASGSGISRNGFDHLLWYYNKGRQ